MIDANDLPALRALREQQATEAAQQEQEKYVHAPASTGLPMGERPPATQRSSR